MIFSQFQWFLVFVSLLQLYVDNISVDLVLLLWLSMYELHFVFNREYWAGVNNQSCSFAIFFFSYGQSEAFICVKSYFKKFFSWTTWQTITSHSNRVQIETLNMSHNWKTWSECFPQAFIKTSIFIFLCKSIATWKVYTFRNSASSSG